MVSDKKTKNVYEWAEVSRNLYNGCYNNCRYCYAKAMAIRYNRLPPDGWENMIPKAKIPSIPMGKHVMFPSTHDINQFNWISCEVYIQKLLLSLNEVLIVSKPCFYVIQQLCHDLNNYKNRIEFRFTIGSDKDKVLKYWEPNAPSIEERLNSVVFALQNGFKVSISCEPLLENDTHIVDMLLAIDAIQEIWIGAMNYVKDKPKLDFHGIYAQYKENPKIKWKNSFLDQMAKVK